jgi:hypothetical protein
VQDKCPSREAKSVVFWYCLREHTFDAPLEDRLRKGLLDSLFTFGSALILSVVRNIRDFAMRQRIFFAFLSLLFVILGIRELFSGQAGDGLFLELYVFMLFAVVFGSAYCRLRGSSEHGPGVRDGTEKENDHRMVPPTKH